MRTFLTIVAAALPVAATLSSAPATAAEFHLYLKCSGKLSSSAAKATPAKLDLALRDNNLTALVQNSDVLPVGERMKYVATEQAYTMQLRTPVWGTQGVYGNWFSGLVFVWHPDLKKLAMTRLSIDRQTAELEGEMLNIEGNVLGKLRMKCTPTSMDDVPAPKF
ncbi:MAG: hypothetical protein AD742_10200 [Methylibium sp. NZG]|nr:MAG: hypothetical protein AD742_10200 [Methylibium sp. NZG]